MSSRKHRRQLLLLAGLSLGALAAPPAQAEGDVAQPAVIVARGSGEVHVRPDSVRVDLGVEIQSPTLEEARRTAGAAMQHVLDALRALGIPNLTLETQNVHFSPVYGSSRDNQPPAIVGYSASNHVLCTATHAPEAELAARSARIVDTALTAGANSVGSIDFFLADSSEAEDDALTRAVKNAASDAEVMARAAGVTLAGPVWIEEANATRMPRALSMEAAMVSTPVVVGDLVITAHVTTKYAFR